MNGGADSEQRKGRLGLTLPGYAARYGLTALAVAAAILAAALSTGGHASVDTVQQLYEALIGRSVSWNPPFMSALLQRFGVGATGGAGLAMAVFVAVVCLGFWGAIILAAHASGKANSRVSLIAWLVSVALCLNPMLLIYAGIVWKDVLFAALLAFVVALMLCAGALRRAGGRTLIIFLAAALIGVLPLVRQQGYVLAPALALILGVLLIWSPQASRRMRGLLVLASLCIAAGTYFAAAAWTQTVIAGNDGRAARVGFQLITQFDLLGIEARGGHVLSPLGAGEAVSSEASEHYSPQRIDFLAQCPKTSAFLAQHNEALGWEFWWRSVREHPKLYLQHRGAVLAHLFGIKNPSTCLPVHLGIDGLPQQLEALGLTARTDVTDRQLYQTLLPLFDGIWFRHISYFVGFLVLAAFVCWRRRGRTRILLLMLIAVGLVFYASFLPTAIACDVRYLFPAVPLLAVLSTAFAFGWREGSDGGV